MKAWLASLKSRGSAPATIRKAYKLLAGVLAEAVKERRIARTPCLDIRPGDLPKIEQSEMRFLSAAEVQELASAIDPRFRPLVLTAAFTGLRFGELAALRLKHVNLLKRTRHRYARVPFANGSGCRRSMPQWVGPAGSMT